MILFQQEIKLTDNNDCTIKAKLHIIECMMNLQKFQEALKISKETYKLCKETFGDVHDYTFAAERYIVTLTKCF